VTGQGLADLFVVVASAANSTEELSSKTIYVFSLLALPFCTAGIDWYGADTNFTSTRCWAQT